MGQLKTSGLVCKKLYFVLNEYFKCWVCCAPPPSLLPPQMLTFSNAFLKDMSVELLLQLLFGKCNENR